MDTVYMRTAAKLLDVGPNELFRFLREKKVFHKGGPLQNTPRLKYIEAGYFKIEFAEFFRGPVKHLSNKPSVTSKGLAFIRELLDGTPLDELDPDRQVSPTKQQGLPRQQSPSGQQNPIRSVAPSRQSEYARDIIRSLRG